MNKLSYLLVLLSIVTCNIYLTDSYTLTTSVLTQLGFNILSTSIAISDNNIDSIDPNAFNGYDKLTVISLSNDNLKTIDIEVFKGAVNLKYLTFYTRSLNKFTNSKNIKFVNLSSLILISNLTSLNKAMFNAFPALKFFESNFAYTDGNIKKNRLAYI